MVSSLSYLTLNFPSLPLINLVALIVMDDVVKGEHRGNTELRGTDRICGHLVRVISSPPIILVLTFPSPSVESWTLSSEEVTLFLFIYKDYQHVISYMKTPIETEPYHCIGPIEINFSP